MQKKEVGGGYRIGVSPIIPAHGFLAGTIKGADCAPGVSTIIPRHGFLVCTTKARGNIGPHASFPWAVSPKSDV